MDARELLGAPLDELLAEARRLRDEGAGGLVTYSPKVFIPLTKLCRDVCHYCTFARPPRRGERAFLSIDEVLAIARAGAAAGCREALFTLGDKPELRYRAARDELARARLRDHRSSTSRPPPARAGGDRPAAAPQPRRDDPRRLRALRRVSRLDGADAGDDRDRALRRAAGRTSARPTSSRPRGSRRSRRPASARPVHDRDPDRHRRDARGAARRAARDPRRCTAARHVQEVIVQNFRAKPGTRMAARPSRRSTSTSGRSPRRGSCSRPRRTCRRRRTSPAATSRACSTPASTTGAASRRSRSTTSTPRRRGPRSSGCARRPRPRARARAAAAGLSGVPRTRPGSTRRVLAARLRASDSLGLAREDGWAPGDAGAGAVRRPPRRRSRVDTPGELGEDELVRLFRARGRGAAARVRGRRRAAPRGRTATSSPTSSRAMSSTRTSATSAAASAPSRRASSRRTCAARRTSSRTTRSRAVREAWERGATEICLQGGIHPRSPATTTSRRRARVKEAVPDMHVHAFSRAGDLAGRGDARRCRSTTTSNGCATRASARCPGTAAEILDDEVRARHLPRQGHDGQWLEVHDAAHASGCARTSTIMFGHVEGPRALGAAPARAARAAARDGRLHRVRAAAVRAHGGADLPARAGRAAGRPSARRC